MQGIASIPYDGIGGNNMDNRIAVYSMSGSTTPGLVEGTGGNRMNVTWFYPGGIVSKTYNGQGLWGYAVVPKSEGGDYSVDDTVHKWLIGDIERTEPIIGAEVPFTEEEIKNESPDVQNAINLLVKAYVHKLMFDVGDDAQMELFKQYFVGCYYSGI